VVNIIPRLFYFGRRRVNMNSQSKYIKVLRKSNWTENAGELPARVIMWKPDDEKAHQSLDTENRYATHIEVKDEQGKLILVWGHYDMTYGTASASFGNRCRQLGVGEDMLTGGLVS
jgi:hypothetical protein